MVLWIILVVAWIGVLAAAAFLYRVATAADKAYRRYTAARSRTNENS